MPEEPTERGRAANDSADRRQLGTRLREAREYLGLSQDEVAKFLGVPRTALSHIESGQRRIDALELKKVASLYKKPVTHFTGEASNDQGLPEDVAHLARAASGLSEADRQELNRFADYLRARAQTERNANE
jgi:transcriptional regulator with XRE-family HTH domain